MAFKKHPSVAPWEEWKVNNSVLFRGTADGEYLENRLAAAFSAGWFACEQAVTDALGTSARARRKAGGDD